MTALAPSLSPSLTSAYVPDNSWLTQNTTEPAGKGPVSTGAGGAFSDPRSGTAPVDLNPSPLEPGSAGPEFAEQAPDYFAESAFPHAGPWPSLPETATGKEAFGTLPDDGITPIGYYKVPPEVTGYAQFKALLPGQITLDGQATDTEGWSQYAPSGRTAVRQSWVQKYLGVQNFWPVTQPNQAKNRVARGGNQSVNGVVAQYGDLANSGGNTVYEAPAPPEVSTQQPEASGGPSIPTWGF